jgi:hypothetical protein
MSMWMIAWAVTDTIMSLAALGLGIYNTRRG